MSFGHKERTFKNKPISKLSFNLNKKRIQNILKSFQNYKIFYVGKFVSTSGAIYFLCFLGSGITSLCYVA